MATLIFRLEAGEEKGRHTDVEAPLLLQSPVLLTANISSLEISAEARRPYERQHFDRFLDLRVPPGGALECFHGRPDAASFVQDLKAVAADHHGVAGPAFVAWLLKLGMAGVGQKIARYEEMFKERLQKSAGSDEMRSFERPIRSFARVFAAGALALKAGVLPHSLTALGESALQFCKAYLADHRRLPVASSIDPCTPLDALTNFIRDEGGALTTLDLKSASAEAVHKAGAFWTSKGDLLLTKERLATVVGNAALANGLRRDLARQGVIGTTGNGTPTRATTVQFYVGEGREKMALIQFLAQRLKFFVTP